MPSPEKPPTSVGGVVTRRWPMSWITVMSREPKATGGLPHGPRCACLACRAARAGARAGITPPTRAKAGRRVPKKER